MLGCPLVVDLDGTLVHADMLHESALRFIQNNLLQVFRIPFWLFKNKALVKQHLAAHTDFDPKSLPYNQELLGWLKQQKDKGRSLILCTASDQIIATSIAEHLGVFDEVIASDGTVNLAGENKARKLESKFGYNGFDYVGNSKTDLAVWKRARRAVVISSSHGLIKKAKNLCDIEQVFFPKSADLKIWGRAFRLHQWLKNLLLFVPLLAAHQLSNLSHWWILMLAFFSFCFCASSVYLINDLLDLESDRLHPRKQQRPFASGQIPPWKGVVLAPLILLISFYLGFYVGRNFLIWLWFYFALTCVYSWGLKRVVLVDCFSLAMLYTLRIVAGAAVVHLDLSFWLLAFSVFLFLSLSFVKRYAELEFLVLKDKEKVHGRGYYLADAPLIQIFGVTSGYVSVLILALYLNSDKVIALYQMPELVWGTVPILLFWISWIWMQAHHGLMHDDPLVFAIKDKVSLWAGLAFTVVISIGAVGLPWY